MNNHKIKIIKIEAHGESDRIIISFDNDSPGYVYCRFETGHATLSFLMTEDEAKEMASSLAHLLGLETLLR